MLILTRKIGESVVIGNNVRVTVIDRSPGVVRLGFEAPPDVSIYREEIHKEIAEANRTAIHEESVGDGEGDESVGEGG
jgi:carbon storage regulator